MNKYFGKVFLGSLLIGGTAIGAAMLANPVVTAGAGIIPSYVIYFICWLFSLATGFLFVELASWLPKDANLMTMAEKFLGAIGKWSVIGVYIFQFYFLLIAYVSLGGKMVIEPICSHIPYVVGVLAFCIFFGLFIVLGAKASSRLNGFLMAGLFVSFFFFLGLSFVKASFTRANYMGWRYAIIGLPVIFTSFSYQGTIPTLYNYLDQNGNKTRKAIFYGTLIPFAAYLVWDFIIKGIVPASGQNGLLEAKLLGKTAVEPLIYWVKDSRIYVVGKFFAFFAIVTSFIGVSLGMIDFFADVFKIPPKGTNRFYLALLILLPTVAVVLINPAIFLIALTLAGGFGAALLLGLLPILLVFLGRRKKGYRGVKRYLPGGQGVLLILFLAILAEIGISILALL